MVKYIIAGTAGHVDHGKSALVQALTGQDPDRLPEEKRRGLTIDLGFAWVDLTGQDPGERWRVGFVDVPGHERFIDHMISGVTGMDVVLFVVAADEGMMPQSYEHLDILNILGVERGIIVVTKCDRADPASVDELIGKIRHEAEGTFLDNAPAVRTSTKTGEGLAELKDVLRKSAAESYERRSVDFQRPAAPARLPVDRVFTRQGFGTIVTGTLISGSVDEDSRLAVYPGAIPFRLRALQSYGEDVTEAAAGQRVALNLAKISTDQVHRGDVIAEQGGVEVAAFLHVSLHISQYCRREVKSGMRIHLLIGTARVLARLYLFRDEGHLAQLRLESPVAAAAGDRFILRFYSPLETIGGGVVLETAGHKCRMSDARVIARLQALERGETVMPAADFGERSGGMSCSAGQTEKKPGENIPSDLKKCADWLLDIHDQAGMMLLSVNAIASDRFDEDKIRRCLRLLERGGRLVRVDGTHFTTPGHAEKVSVTVAAHFREHHEISLGELRDILKTNRTSARAFFAYLDRKKITQQTGGAATRTSGPNMV